VRSRYSWPPRGVPIDPSSQALPDNQFVMLSVHNALNQPSNPKLIMFGGTALMMAAAGGHMDIAQMLFSAGASLTLKSRSGYTAKDYARIFGHSKIATWLEGQEHRGNLREANVQGTFLPVDEPTVQPTVSVIRRSKFRLAEAYAEAPPQVEPVLQERNVVPDQGFHPAGFACDHSDVACASTCAAGHD